MLDARGRFAPDWWTEEHLALLDSVDRELCQTITGFGFPIRSSRDLEPFIARFPNLNELWLERPESIAPLAELPLRSLIVDVCPAGGDLTQLRALDHLMVSFEHEDVLVLPEQLLSLDVRKGPVDLRLPRLKTLALRANNAGFDYALDALPALSEITVGNAELLSQIQQPLERVTASTIHNDAQADHLLALDARRLRVDVWRPRYEDRGARARADDRFEHLGVPGDADAFAPFFSEMSSLKTLYVNDNEVTFPWPPGVLPAPSLARRILGGRTRFDGPMPEGAEEYERLGAVHALDGAYPKLRKIQFIKIIRELAGVHLLYAKELSEAVSDGCARYLTTRERDVLVVARSRAREQHR